MADKRKKKTEYVISGGVDNSLTKDQPDEEPQEESKVEKEPQKQNDEKAKEKDPIKPVDKPDPPKQNTSDLGGGEFLKQQGSENPFDVKISTFKPDPRLVKVDQFYPQLEHQFNKSKSKFMEEQDKRVERAMKEIVEESSTFTYDETSTIGPEDSEASMALVKVPGTEQKDNEEAEKLSNDDNNSAKQVIILINISTKKFQIMLIKQKTGKKDIHVYCSVTVDFITLIVVAFQR